MRAMHPIRLGGATGGSIEDRSRADQLVLVIARKQEKSGEEITWDRLEEILAPDVTACLETWWPQVETGELGTAEVAVEVLGICLRHFCRFAGDGQSRVMWRGQPVTLMQALDGDPAAGIQGFTRLVDLAVFRREGQLWPAEVDEPSRFYLTTLLGQSILSEARLAWRLETLPSLSAADVQEQRLVRWRGGHVRVLTVRQRLPHLRRRWEQEQSWLAQPQLPGLASGSQYLTAIDRLHLLLGLLAEGEDVLPWLDGWRSLDSLAGLAQQIASRLPLGGRRRRYAQVAARLQQAASTTG